MSDTFWDRIKREVATKPFFHESDRAVAQGIIKTFFEKRLLVDSIARNSPAEVHDLLTGMSEEIRQLLLDAPVDGARALLLKGHRAALIETNAICLIPDVTFPLNKRTN